MRRKRDRGRKRDLICSTEENLICSGREKEGGGGVCYEEEERSTPRFVHLLKRGVLII